MRVSTGIYNACAQEHRKQNPLSLSAQIIEFKQDWWTERENNPSLSVHIIIVVCEWITHWYISLDVKCAVFYQSWRKAWEDVSYQNGRGLNSDLLYSGTYVSFFKMSSTVQEWVHRPGPTVAPAGGAWGLFCMWGISWHPISKTVTGCKTSVPKHMWRLHSSVRAVHLMAPNVAVS